MADMRFQLLILSPFPVVYYAVSSLIQLYVLMIIVWVIISWVDHRNGFLHDLYNVLDGFVAPYVNIFRQFLRPMGGLDFSPVLAILLLQLLARFL